MRSHSPIRSVSPNARPKIVFNYQVSPIKQQKTESRYSTGPHANTSQTHIQYPGNQPLQLNNTQQLRNGLLINQHPLQTPSQLCSTQNNSRSPTINPQSSRRELSPPPLDASNSSVSHQPKPQACEQCGKNATYRIAKSNTPCCSVCAINHMKNEIEVVRIENRPLPLRQKQLNIQKAPAIRGQTAPLANTAQETPKNKAQSTSSTTPFVNPGKDKQKIFSGRFMSPTAEENKETKAEGGKKGYEIKTLLEQVASSQKEINRMLGIFNQEIFSEENIHSLYKQKKLNLKKHYEKIKTAIKESIDKDLEQLEKREKQQLTMIDTKRKQLAFDAQKLSRIKTDAINLENQGKDIAAVEEKLAEITKKNKTEAGKITDWKATVANAGSEDFLSSISRATDEQFSCHLKFTLESLQKGKDYLYEPEMYMMIQSKGANKDPSYFSFEKKRTSTG